jgi:Zn-dependent protease with chaperone function
MTTHRATEDRAASGALLVDADQPSGRRVTLALEGSMLRLADGEGRIERVPLDRLARSSEGAAGRLVLRRQDAPDWLLRPDSVAGWMTTLPRPRPPGLRRRNAALVALAVGLAVTLWAWGGALLEAAAPLVPRRITQPLGEAVAAQVGADRRCVAPAGQAALDALVERVRPPDLPARVRVAPVAEVNAFAAPGGLVVLNRGLIEKAASPEEVAGVLAHELAHVELMHPEQALLRHFGVSVLVGSVAGDVGRVIDSGLVLARSRDAERAADARGAAMLARVGIPAAPLGDFLARLAAAQRPAGGAGTPAQPSRAGQAIGRTLETLGGYLASHPGAEERVAALRAAPQPAAVRPVLTVAQWQSLRGICAQIEDARGKPVGSATAA